MMDGPVYFTDDERNEWLDTQITPMVIKPDGSHLMKVWDRVVALDPDHPPELCHREAIDTLRAGQRWHEAYIACLHQDYADLYSRVKCPMLLLCGDNDVLFPYFGRLCDKYPDVKSVILPGGGTYAPDNCAQPIVEEILTFLKEIEKD
jgi:pimeloyl-ACP methyl ester carboxylesterase